MHRSENHVGSYSMRVKCPSSAGQGTEGSSQLSFLGGLTFVFEPNRPRRSIHPSAEQLFCSKFAISSVMVCPDEGCSARRLASGSAVLVEANGCLGCALAICAVPMTTSTTNLLDIMSIYCVGTRSTEIFGFTSRPDVEVGTDFRDPPRQLVRITMQCSWRRQRQTLLLTDRRCSTRSGLMHANGYTTKNSDPTVSTFDANNTGCEFHLRTWNRSEEPPGDWYVRLH